MSLTNVRVSADNNYNLSNYVNIKQIYQIDGITRIAGLQTKDDYDWFYEGATGNIKDDIIFNGWSTNLYNSYQYDGFINSIDYIGNDNYIDYQDLYFKPIIIDNETIPFNDCMFEIALTSDSNGNYLTLYLFYSPDNTPMYNCGSEVFSEHTFYYTLVRYSMMYHSEQHDGADYNDYYARYNLEYESNVTYQASSDSFAWGSDGFVAYHVNNVVGVISSNQPIYYTWNGRNDVNNGYYTNNGYEYPRYIYRALKDNDDTSGFIVDRRVITSNYFEDDDIHRDEIDYTLFDGKLGFNGFYPQSSINGKYNDNSQIWRCNPFTYIKYSLNNYTRLKPPEEVLIKFDTKCYVKYKTSLGYYQSWVWNSSMDYPVTDAPDELFLNYVIFKDVDAKYNANWTNNQADGSYMFLNSQEYLEVINYYYIRQLKYADNDFRYYPDTDDLVDSTMLTVIKLMWNKGADSVPHYLTDLQIYFDTTAYLYDTVTGETSGKTNFKFDLIEGDTSYDDGAVYDDDKEYSDFISDFDFDNDDKPIIYVPSQPIIINPGVGYGDDSAHASIGDITINPGASEVIVDMSAEEWLQHSPTFNNMMTAVKQGYLDTAEDSGSVLALMRTTYDIFPDEVWTYLLTAVGVISTLAVIRYIRRG